MQEKIIELKQAPVVLVELNKEIEVDSWIKFGSPIIIDYPNKVIGKLSDLTEEQFAECVHSEINSLRTKTIHKDYKGSPMWFFTAKDSFRSLLESEKVYTKSQAYPDIHDPKYYDEPYAGTGFYQEIYSSDIVDWNEAQQRTIDPERTVVLLKK